MNLIIKLCIPYGEKVPRHPSSELAFVLSPQALGVNSIALGDNSKAYGDNSKGYGDRIHPYKKA